MDSNLKIAIEEIEKELRRVSSEDPLMSLRNGVPLWEDTVLEKALRNGDFGDEVDDVGEAVEELRQEQQDLLLSMTLQALHDDTVNFVAWNFPSGVTAYLVESWNGETQLFAIDTDGFSDKEAAKHLSRYIRSVYMETTSDETSELQISILNVNIELQNNTTELELLRLSAAC